MKNPISQSHSIEPDVLLVHKPVGISSFDVIRRLRPILGIRKIGHAGTLDPLASGLMIIGINKGTKKLSHYLKLPKVYVTEVLVGKSTTTGDLEGEVVEEKYPKKGALKEEDIKKAVDSLLGTHLLSVPLYSAIKVQGKALYAYAREGKTPPYIPEKEMNIRSIKLLRCDYREDGYRVQIRLDVSSGTYIRSLGELLGERLGYPATLSALYRESIGEYRDVHAYRFTSPSTKTRSLLGAIMKWLTIKP